MLGTGVVMQHFIRQFRREGAGVWVCVGPASVNLPEGRIQTAPGARFTIGMKFMNVDVARLLDAEYSRQRAGDKSG
jgi:hypothetical protein